MVFSRVLAASLLTLTVGGGGAAAAEVGHAWTQLVPADGVTLAARARARAIRDFRPSKERKAAAFRPRKQTILRYERPLQLGQSDLLIRIRAPGKGKSIASFELKF